MAAVVCAAVALPGAAGAGSGTPATTVDDPTTSAQAVTLVRDVVTASTKACKLSGVAVRHLRATPAGRLIRVTFKRPQPKGAVFYVPFGKVVAGDPMAGRIAHECEAKDPPKPRSRNDWKGLPYWNWQTGAFDVVSNGDRWRGARRVTGIKPGALGKRPTWTDRQDVVWGSRCRSGKQSIRLRRTLYLPGAPEGKVAVALAGRAFQRSGSGRGRPVRAITRMELRVNGRRVLRTSSSDGSARISSTAWRVGTNRLELRATKKSTGACNRGSKGLQLGIEARITSLSKHFVGDLSVKRARPTSEQGRLTFGFDITNKGPSAVIDGTFEARVEFSGGIRLRPGVVHYRSTRKDTTCTSTPVTADSTGVKLTCVVARLTRGRKETIKLGVAPVVPNGAKEQIDVRWTARGYQDLRNSDHQGQARAPICAPDVRSCS